MGTVGGDLSFAARTILFSGKEVVKVRPQPLRLLPRADWGKIWAQFSQGLTKWETLAIFIGVSADGKYVDHVSFGNVHGKDIVVNVRDFIPKGETDGFSFLRDAAPELVDLLSDSGVLKLTPNAADYRLWIESGWGTPYEYGPVLDSVALAAAAHPRRFRSLEGRARRARLGQASIMHMYFDAQYFPCTEEEWRLSGNDSEFGWGLPPNRTHSHLYDWPQKSGCLREEQERLCVLSLRTTVLAALEGVWLRLSDEEKSRSNHCLSKTFHRAAKDLFPGNAQQMKAWHEMRLSSAAERTNESPDVIVDASASEATARPRRLKITFATDSASPDRRGTKRVTPPSPEVSATKRIRPSGPSDDERHKMDAPSRKNGGATSDSDSESSSSSDSSSSSSSSETESSESSSSETESEREEKHCRPSERSRGTEKSACRPGRQCDNGVRSRSRDSESSHATERSSRQRDLVGSSRSGKPRADIIPAGSQDGPKKRRKKRARQTRQEQLRLAEAAVRAAVRRREAVSGGSGDLRGIIQEKIRREVSAEDQADLRDTLRRVKKRNRGKPRADVSEKGATSTQRKRKRCPSTDDSGRGNNEGYGAPLGGGQGTSGRAKKRRTRRLKRYYGLAELDDQVVRYEHGFLGAEICHFCGEKTHQDKSECWVQQYSQTRIRVPGKELPCLHCHDWKHVVDACPFLHHKCGKCHKRGHVQFRCTDKTLEEHLEQFCRHAPLGILTRQNLSGPIDGKFGFGSVPKAAVTKRVRMAVRLAHAQIALMAQERGQQPKRLHEWYR